MLIRRRRTALSKSPHALADGLMLVFNTLKKADRLFAPSLMARFGQQFLVFVLTHLLAAFFDHTAQ